MEKQLIDTANLLQEIYSESMKSGNWERMKTAYECRKYLIDEMYTKEQVIEIVAKFGSTYNTDALGLSDMDLETAKKDVAPLIDFNHLI